jgi:hypothetical protein
MDYPGGTSTITRGLNNMPVFVGHYTDSNGVEHGFYAMRSAQ